MAQFELLFWHLPGGTYESDKKLQSGQSVSKMRFESRISQDELHINKFKYKEYYLLGCAAQ
jgi:hypothetical protein